MHRSSWMLLADIGAAGFIVAAVAWVVAYLFTRIARRADLPSLVALDRYCRRAWVVTISSVAMLVTAYGLDLSVGRRRAAGV